MKIISVVGARPNFMKIAPFIRAVDNHNNHAGASVSKAGIVKGGSTVTRPEPITHILVHTGQHYDDAMSKAFFSELEIPEADINLQIGSGTHAEQVGQTMIAFEKVLKSEKPDWVVVVGDVNATLACSVTAKKEWIKVCHIEAGLRSHDLTMPEEINRLVTDRLSDLLLAPDMLSVKNLRDEGVHESRIRFTGNIMIDTLEANREKAGKLEVAEIIERNRSGETVLIHHKKLPRESDGNRYENGSYGVVTLHRPSNVDSRDILEAIVNFLTEEVAKETLLLWPIHPRTRKMISGFGLSEKIAAQQNVILLEPLGYLDMLRLNMGARFFLTDSGGLQEECTVLGTPCLTLRRNTERPVTLREHGGASILVGNDIDTIRKEYKRIIQMPRMPVRPELWDGNTAERCLKAILEYPG